MDIYREEILSHYNRPHNFGDLPHPALVGREANASCGDLLEFQLTIRDSRISDLRFKGVGCALSIAAASMLSDRVKGKSLSYVSRLTEQSMRDLVGVEITSARIRCITLPLRALLTAIAQRRQE